MAKVNEVIFYSKSSEMLIGAERVQKENRAPDGRIITGSGMIQFENNIFRTDDPKIIAHIKQTNAFAVGKVRIITEEQAAGVMSAQQARVDAIVHGVPEQGSSEPIDPIQASLAAYESTKEPDLNDAKI